MCIIQTLYEIHSWKSINVNALVTATHPIRAIRNLVMFWLITFFYKKNVLLAFYQAKSELHAQFLYSTSIKWYNWSFLLNSKQMSGQIDHFCLHSTFSSIIYTVTLVMFIYFSFWFCHLLFSTDSEVWRYNEFWINIFIQNANPMT